jgi:hypothetical protein
MTAYAPSTYQGQSANEIGSQQLTAEERDKLQEIHELINLLIRELPATAQARPTAVPAPAVPYAYSFLRFPCG